MGIFKVTILLWLSFILFIFWLFLSLWLVLCILVIFCDSCIQFCCVLVLVTSLPSHQATPTHTCTLSTCHTCSHFSSLAPVYLSASTVERFLLLLFLISHVWFLLSSLGSSPKKHFNPFHTDTMCLNESRHKVQKFE